MSRRVPPCAGCHAAVITEDEELYGTGELYGTDWPGRLPGGPPPPGSRHAACPPSTENSAPVMYVAPARWATVFATSSASPKRPSAVIDAWPDA